MCIRDRSKLIWNRSIIPRHAFITWLYAQKRLPTKTRLARFTDQSTTCSICHSGEEDDQHLFFDCEYAQGVWRELENWWQLPSQHSGLSWELSCLRSKGTQTRSCITYAIFAAGIYYIWHARNKVIFQNQKIPSHSLIQVIKDQVRNRILFINAFSKKYEMYVDRLLT